MLQFIYSMKLSSLILLMLILLLFWSCVDTLIRHRTAWKTLNALFALLSLLAILYTTILNRSQGSHEVNLRPFASLIAAVKQPEIYRAMLMNVFLFFPFGLSFSTALPGKHKTSLKIILTTIVGCALSIAVEYTQYRYGLGVAEVDDVICNTIGMFFGSTALIIMRKLQ